MMRCSGTGYAYARSIGAHTAAAVNRPPGEPLRRDHGLVLSLNVRVIRA